jgi:biopolymer transport protein ExbD
MKRKAHPHEHEVELNLIPYLDIMVNLVMFMLLSMTGFLAFQMINVNMPDLSQGAGSGEPPPKSDAEKLTLNISVSTKGFYLAASGGVLPGESAPGTGQVDTKTSAPTIPIKGMKLNKETNKEEPEYDYEKLTARMWEIKKAYPAVSQFFLAADKAVRYDVIIQTMDATRGDPTKPLFPDVAFAAVM